MEAIRVEGLNKMFRTKVKAEGLRQSARALFRPIWRDIQAVRDICFTVEPGEVLAFIGPNGAGKSTTIKMLTGILHPSSGSIDVLGYNPQRDRAKLSYHIGTVFGQKSQLWFHLPPMDSFRLLASIYDLKPAQYQDRLDMLIQRFELGSFHLLASIYDLKPAQYQDRLDMLIQRFELGSFLDQPVRKLSLGQRVRCEVAASLLHRPKIIFLDEPTIGLDVVVKQSIRQLITELNREEGVTIFLTSHDAGDIEQLCRRAMVIDHGTVVLDQPVKRLKYDYLNRKVIAVRYSDTMSLPVIEGVQVAKAAGNAARLVVDTRTTNIGEVLQAVSAAGAVADITISDPPMEEIIGEIFRREGGAPPCSTDANT